MKKRFSQYSSIVVKIFFFYCLIISELFSQNAVQYYDLISKAEIEFVSNKLNQSLIYYDSAFTKFDYPFYRNIRQAAIIGSYSNDKGRYHKFLKKCVKRGMTINELEFFAKRTPKDGFVIKLYNDFEKYRSEFLTSIDTFTLFNYLETDMLEQIAMENFSDPISFHKAMKKIGEIYMKIVDSLGFPDERKLGLCYFTLISDNDKKDPLSNWYQIKLKYHKKEAGFTNHLYGSIRVEDLIDKPYSMKPGNWFVSHYHTENYIIDTLFYDYLKIGMYQLKIHPITLALFLERTGLNDFEFLMTYYSPLYLKMKMKLKKALFVDDKTKKAINKNRKTIFVRPIERELEIVNELYKLRFNKLPKKINKRIFHRIQYEIDAFLKYF